MFPDRASFATVITPGTTQVAASEGAAPHLQTVLPNLMAAVREYNDDLAPTLRIIGLGSSVGLGPDGNLDNVASTTAWLASQLEPWLNRLQNQTWSATNGSVAGTTIISGVQADYAAAKVAAGGTPNVVILTYGMNEGTPAQYYGSLTLPGVYKQGLALIEMITADGADIIICGTPHLNTRTYVFGYGGPYTYPGSQKPLQTAAVVNVLNADGVSVPACYYHLRVNEQLRQLAADTGCVFLDVERYWLQLIAKYGTAALFGSGETVHPNLFGYQNSFHTAINDLVTAFKRPTVRPGGTPLQRSGWQKLPPLGKTAIAVASGGAFTIALPAGVGGRLLIGGSSGGGNQSTWEGVFITRADGSSAVSAGANCHLGGSQCVANVAGGGAGTNTTLTVTAAATGSGCVFDWNAEFFTT